MTTGTTNKNGFTLVEMLVVILIIGILAAVLIPTLVSSQCRAKEATVQNMIKNIKNNLVQYKMDKGRYPPETSEAGSEPLYKALSQKKGRGSVYYEFEDEYLKPADEDKKVYSAFGADAGYPDAYEIHYALPRGEDYERMWRYDGDHPSPDQLNETEINLWTAGCSYSPENSDKKALYELNNFE